MTEFKEIQNLFNISERNGFSDAEIREHKKVFNVIPKILYDYYYQLGKICNLNHTQDNLLEPDKLQLSKNKDYLIFYVENQWACVWGININDLMFDNPAVYTSIDQNDWEIEAEKLTDFLTAMANLQAVFSLPYSSEEFSEIYENYLSIIRQNFKRRNFCFKTWIGIEFYGNNDNDVIAVMKNNEYYDLLFASANKIQFDKMNEILNELG